MRVKAIVAGLMMLGAGFAWLISVPTKSDAG
jgi:hypothetical protein